MQKYEDFNRNKVRMYKIITEDILQEYIQGRTGSKIRVREILLRIQENF